MKYLIPLLVFFLGLPVAHSQTSYAYNKSKRSRICNKAYADKNIQYQLSRISKSQTDQYLFISMISVLPTLQPYEVNQIAVGCITYLRNEKIINKKEHELLCKYVKGSRSSYKIASEIKRLKPSTPLGGGIMNTIVNTEGAGPTAYGAIRSGAKAIGAIGGLLIGAGIGGGAGAIGGAGAGAGGGTVVLPIIGTISGAGVGAIGGGGAGAIAGGGAGAGAGAIIGDAVGEFIEDVIAESQDSTSTAAVKDGDKKSGFMLGPNGEDCLPPLFQF